MKNNGLALENDKDFMKEISDYMKGRDMKSAGNVVKQLIKEHNNGQS
jgi:hypothetical protein